MKSQTKSASDAIAAFAATPMTGATRLLYVPQLQPSETVLNVERYISSVLQTRPFCLAKFYFQSQDQPIYDITVDVVREYTGRQQIGGTQAELFIPFFDADRSVPMVQLLGQLTNDFTGTIVCQFVAPGDKKGVAEWTEIQLGGPAPQQDYFDDQRSIYALESDRRGWKLSQIQLSSAKPTDALVVRQRGRVNDLVLESGNEYYALLKREPSQFELIDEKELMLQEFGLETCVSPGLRSICRQMLASNTAAAPEEDDVETRLKLQHVRELTEQSKALISQLYEKLLQADSVLQAARQKETEMRSLYVQSIVQALGGEVVSQAQGESGQRRAQDLVVSDLCQKGSPEPQRMECPPLPQERVLRPSVSVYLAQQQLQQEYNAVLDSLVEAQEQINSLPPDRILPAIQLHNEQMRQNSRDIAPDAPRGPHATKTLELLKKNAELLSVKAAELKKAQLSEAQRAKDMRIQIEILKQNINQKQQALNASPLSTGPFFSKIKALAAICRNISVTDALSGPQRTYFFQLRAADEILKEYQRGGKQFERQVYEELQALLKTGAKTIQASRDFGWSRLLEVVAKLEAL